MMMQEIIIWWIWLINLILLPGFIGIKIFNKLKTINLLLGIVISIILGGLVLFLDVFITFVVIYGITTSRSSYSSNLEFLLYLGGVLVFILLIFFRKGWPLIFYKIIEILVFLTIPFLI